MSLMNTTTDKDDEELTMSSRKRRSSILKLPKNRNPFEEIDEPCEENIASRSVRRVSFATSNFIKPFVADPDKNTIWDTTYEEEINHTDSTHSSQEHNTHSKVESTFSTSTKSLLVSDMEITRCVAFEGDENIPPMEQRISIVDYAKKLATNSVVPLYTPQSKKNDYAHRTKLSSETMEFTCMLPHSNEKSSCQDTSELKLADTPSTNLNQTLYNNELIKTEDSLPSDMEISCAIPNKTNTNLINQSVLNDLELTCQESVNSERSQLDNNMEFTCQFSKSIVTNAVNCNSTKNDNKENPGHSLATNKTKIKDKTLEDMEFTCQVSNTAFQIKPDINISTQPDSSQLQLSKTMEILCENETVTNLSNNQMLLSETCSMEISDIKSPAITNTYHKSSKIPIRCCANSLDDDTSANCRTNLFNAESVHFQKNGNLENTISKNVTFEENLMKMSNQGEQCSIVEDGMDLELTCTPAFTEERLTERKNISSLHSMIQKTPEPSFHINLTNISSGVDDTQHLIHCSYRNCDPEPMNITQLANSNVDLKLIKEDTVGDVDLPNLTNLNETDLNETDIDKVPRANTTSFDVSHVDFETNKLTRVNDTYTLKGKGSQNNKTYDENEDSLYTSGLCGNKEGDYSTDSSLGIVDPNQLDDIEEMKCEEPQKSSCEKWLTNREVKEYNFNIKRSSEFKHVSNKAKQQQNQLKRYLETFKFKPINIFKEFIVSEEIQKKINEQATRDKNEVIECTELSLEQKIKIHQERSGYSWKLENIVDNQYTFSTLFGILVFTVEIDHITRTVISIKTSNKLADSSEPIAFYILKLFLEKLDNYHLQSAIGKSYDVLSLLDYVQMTMMDLHNLQTELVNSHILTLDENFIAKFKVMSIKAMILCEVSIDVRDLDHLDFDTAKIVCKTGNVNECELKNVIKRCPKGLHFFREFVSCIEEYIKMKEKKKIG